MRAEGFTFRKEKLNKKLQMAIELDGEWPDGIPHFQEQMKTRLDEVILFFEERWGKEDIAKAKSLAGFCLKDRISGIYQLCETLGDQKAALALNMALFNAFQDLRKDWNIAHNNWSISRMIDGCSFVNTERMAAAIADEMGTEITPQIEEIVEYMAKIILEERQCSKTTGMGKYRFNSIKRSILNSEDIRFYGQEYIDALERLLQVVEYEWSKLK